MVFVAEQIRIGREVALKTILPKIAIDPSYMERFKREAYLLKDLVSPHTVRLYDFGCTKKGLPYLVMELLKGATLQETLDGTTFDDNRAFHIVSQILKSLVCAHQKNVIHRDIKPENIMLVDIPGEKAEFVKLLDFGIGKTIGKDSKSMKQLTQAGIGCGTPNYMAPELLLGKEIGPWSDLYSVGLILIELLSGEVAIPGETPMVIVSQQLTPDPVEIPASIMSSRLIPVIKKAINKDKTRRFQSAEEFLSAMEEILSPSNMTINTPDKPKCIVRPKPQDVQNNANKNKTTEEKPARTFPEPYSDPPEDLQSEDFLLPTPPKNYKKLAVLTILFILLATVGYMVCKDKNTTQPGTRSEKGEASLVAADGPTKQLIPDNTEKQDPVVIEKTDTPKSKIVSEVVNVKEKIDVPKKIVVKISSKPDGATVYSGKEKIGETPMKLTILADAETKKLKLRKKGYQTKTVELTPQNLEIKAKLKLKPQKKGTNKTNGKGIEIGVW